MLQGDEFILGQDALAEQARPHLHQWIAQRVGFALGLGTIEPVVVGERVGVGPHAVAVNKGRPQPGAAVGHSGLKGPETGLRIGAVHLGKIKIRMVGHQPRDVAARHAHLDRSADRVAVVLHAKDHRQLAVRGGVHRLPEFALRGGTLAQQGQHHLVAVKLHLAEGAVVAIGLGCGFGMAAEIAPGLGAANCVQQLRGGGGRCADDVQRTAAPVRRHLAAAAGRIGGRAHSLQEHFVRGDAQRQAERAVAIVRKEPVVAGTHGQSRAHSQRLVARAGDLEVGFLLALEQDFAVVHAAREHHQPVDLDQLPRAEAAGACRHGLASAGNCHFHSLAPHVPV